MLAVRSRRRFLGALGCSPDADYSAPRITITPDGGSWPAQTANFVFSAPAPLVEPISVTVAVDGTAGTLQLQGRCDNSHPDWIQPGHVFTWTVLDGSGNLLLTHVLDYRQAQPTQSDSVTPAALAAIQPPSSSPAGGAGALPASQGGGSPAPAGGASAPVATSLSWFQQSTSILGTTIPNTYLLAGIALVAVIAISKKGAR